MMNATTATKMKSVTMRAELKTIRTADIDVSTGLPQRCRYS